MGYDVVASYQVPSTQVDPTNWVGLYRWTQTPGSGYATAWAYAGAANDRLSFTTTGLAPGVYKMAMFAKNGYTALTPFVTVTIN